MLASLRPTLAERRLLRDVVRALEQANARTLPALERLEATVARAITFDEEAYRAEVEAELLARDDIDWNALTDALDPNGVDPLPVEGTKAPTR